MTTRPQADEPAGAGAEAGDKGIAMKTKAAVLALSIAYWAPMAMAQGLPPVPVPSQNPVTEAKRVLGKILFWDEQLSSDDTMACGTCHIPSAGGADPRQGVNPGADGVFGTADDVLGSPGVVHRDASGAVVDDPVFGTAPQVTGRAAPSFFANLHAPELFWDGRASSTFVDPADGTTVLIATGGALESQAVGPILSSVEMATDGRSWADVTAKLEIVRPLRLADDLPPDVAAAIDAAGSYPALFAAAFGDGAITPARIGFAIATYERTLVPDQTPWDLFIAGQNNAMTAQEIRGWNAFRGNGARCDDCHRPPLFTNNDFLNLGLRPADEDEGRLTVSGLAEDFGDMKMPGLRNVGLRASLMHTGTITGVPDALDFYLQARGHRFFTDDQDGIPPDGAALATIRIPPDARADIIAFLSTGLTDPRAAAEEFPFDRPTLASELGDGVVRCTPVAMPDCGAPVVDGRSRFGLEDEAGAADDRLQWKWSNGHEIALADLGDPATTDGMVLCAYSGEDAATLELEVRAPAGADWKVSSSGAKFKSKSGAPDGIRKLKIKTGADGKAKISLKAAGAELEDSPVGLPATPLALPLEVQLQSATGSCWAVRYGRATANASGVFTAN